LAIKLKNIYKGGGCLTTLYILYTIFGVIFLIDSIISINQDLISDKNELLIILGLSFSGILLIVSSIGAIYRRKWGVILLLVVHLGGIINMYINRVGELILILLLSCVILIVLVRPYYKDYL
jgi:hypothetical protein